MREAATRRFRRVLGRTNRFHTGEVTVPKLKTAVTDPRTYSFSVAYLRNESAKKLRETLESPADNQLKSTVTNVWDIGCELGHTMHTRSVNKCLHQLNIILSSMSAIAIPEKRGRAASPTMLGAALRGAGSKLTSRPEASAVEGHHGGDSW